MSTMSVQEAGQSPQLSNGEFKQPPHDDLQKAYFGISRGIWYLQDDVRKNATFVDDEIASFQKQLTETSLSIEPINEISLPYRMMIDSILLPLHIYGSSINAMNFTENQGRRLREKYFKPVFPQLATVGRELIKEYQAAPINSLQTSYYSGLIHELCFNMLMSLDATHKGFSASTNTHQDRHQPKARQIDAKMYLHPAKSEPLEVGVQIKSKQRLLRSVDEVLHVYGDTDLHNCHNDPSWQEVGIKGIFPTLQVMLDPEKINNPLALARLQQIRSSLIQRAIDYSGQNKAAA